MKLFSVSTRLVISLAVLVLLINRPVSAGIRGRPNRAVEERYRIDGRLTDDRSDPNTKAPDDHDRPDHNTGAPDDDDRPDPTGTGAPDHDRPDSPGAPDDDRPDSPGAPDDDDRPDPNTGARVMERAALNRLVSLSDKEYFLDADTDHCRWSGIECDSEGFVVSIEMNDRGLRGAIPAELGSLEKLETLNLANNFLISIPNELGDLKSLKYLYLDANLLDGGIPYDLTNLKNLVKLSLNDNRSLGGRIPWFLRRLSSLEYLGLRNCGLVGNIPEELWNLKKLKTLDLRNNQLDGAIPWTLKQLRGLRIYLYDRRYEPPNEGPAGNRSPYAGFQASPDRPRLSKPSYTYAGFNV